MHDLLFLLSKGIEFKQVNDMWMDFLDRMGIEKGALNNRIYKWLGSLGGTWVPAQNPDGSPMLNPDGSQAYIPGGGGQYTGSYSDRYSQWVRDTQMLPHDCFIDPDSGEFIPNWSFDCGLYRWGFDPTYPAILTDNGDGSVHLKTDSNFGSLVPQDDTFPNGDWVLEAKVRNVVGNGKLSIRRPNGTWVTNTTYTSDGTYSTNYSGIIAEIHVGADGDATFEADYDHISLRKRTVNSVTFDGELVTYNNEQVFYG